MYKSELAVAVMCEFFVRPEQFAQVFEQVKKARPSTLLLYQDGPRDDRKDDVENIKKCREIAENIDWECKVYKLYQNRNFGCDPSGYLAQTWALSIVDCCIILEDDCVPSQSFFPYCAELLEKYKDDERIGMICGMNSLGTVDDSNSYFYSKYMSIWGWATWKRVVEKWDANYKFLNDPYSLQLLKCNLGKKKYKHFINICKQHINLNKEHFESLQKSYMYLNNTLSIIPTKNMITNIGVAAETTHGTDNIKKYAKVIQKLFFMERHETEMPIEHPKHIIENKQYEKKIERLLSYHRPLMQFFRGIECFIRKIIYR